MPMMRLVAATSRGTAEPVKAAVPVRQGDARVLDQLIEPLVEYGIAAAKDMQP